MDIQQKTLDFLFLPNQDVLFFDLIIYNIICNNSFFVFTTWPTFNELIDILNSPFIPLYIPAEYFKIRYFLFLSTNQTLTNASSKYFTKLSTIACSLSLIVLYYLTELIQIQDKTKPWYRKTTTYSSNFKESLREINSKIKRFLNHIKTYLTK